MQTQDSSYLAGKILIAMPNMGDPRFERSVIYMCHHDARGAMGLVLNKVLGGLSFPDLLKQFDIVPKGSAKRIQVHFGGPVEPGVGFVLHTSEYRLDATMPVGDAMALTATVDVLRDMADGSGPRAALVALGYAGWAPGQLDNEIQQNAWLHGSAEETLIFDRDLNAKWPAAVRALGIDISLLSSDAGHA